MGASTRVNTTNEHVPKSSASLPIELALSLFSLTNSAPAGAATNSSVGANNHFATGENYDEELLWLKNNLC